MGDGRQCQCQGLSTVVLDWFMGYRVSSCWVFSVSPLGNCVIRECGCIVLRMSRV